ncbi:uncharacterized protein LOC112592240 [Melanaphis sacchari]|uniref:uncharacterized protein LOC112592240 n=1 Tax=Melanaphis sacchari TaxID=742174 RepID=UPI000DC14D13|nr:uncharacterized protein LOC112592240 [Melanaphis sacchari]
MTKTIYSDNGTNFVGANQQLQELQNLFLSEQHKHQVQTFLTEIGVKWKFIPPRAPHFGGLWEAAVKSVKGHLRKTLGNAMLIYEELYTVLVRIEACLNSRPITPLSSDPTDLRALTPGHFLIGSSLNSIPDIDVSAMASNRLRRWQRTIQLTQQIWHQWRTEYLSQLQGRKKWLTSKGAPLKEGTLVILREENIPPLHWRLGRVTKILAGNDGVMRVAMVKTERGEIKRTVRTLCPLPTDE